MGTCVYCGRSTSLFRKAHRECRETYNKGFNQLIVRVKHALVRGENLDPLEADLTHTATHNYVPKAHIRTAVIRGWSSAVEGFLEDRVLTKEEEAKLMALSHRFALSHKELDETGAYTRTLRAAILRDLMEGRVPTRIEVAGYLPFNLQKSEVLIYVFRGTAYYEERTRREYVGRSAGVSIRIMKGVYYRTSAFRGHPVDREHTVHVDTGLLGVTTKHIYFAGARKSFRIRHDKIVTLVPYSDGVGIHRDAATAKPQIFQTGDGWFTYNLLANVSQLG